MPSRPITVAIVILWLGAMSWLFVRDIWPVLRPGQRPPFTIDLSREATGRKSVTHWGLYHNGVRVGYANTVTHYHSAEQTYELVTQLRFEKFRFPIARSGIDVELRRMIHTDRVTSDGELRGVETELEAGYGSPAALLGLVHIKVRGEVEDGSFTPHLSIQAPNLQVPILRDLLNQEQALEPVSVPTHDSFFNPMKPWNRLLDVREGQTWKMALFDPLSVSRANLVPGMKAGPSYLEAGVLQGTQELFWDGQSVPCLVIEYRGKDDEMVARTWVRQSDGLVLRQEAEKTNDRLTLEREPK